MCGDVRGKVSMYIFLRDQVGRILATIMALVRIERAQLLAQGSIVLGPERISRRFGSIEMHGASGTEHRRRSNKLSP